MRLILFTRQVVTNFYNNIISKSELKKFQLFYITEFYDEYKDLPNAFLFDFSKKVNENFEIFNEIEIEDIIKRDRLLSTLGFEDAISYVNSASYQLIKIYDEVSPDLVFSHLVDTYVFDIFLRIAEKRKIKKFSMVWGGINNTFKFYDYCTPIKRNTPNLQVDLFQEFQQNRIDISNPDTNKDNILKRLKDKTRFFKYQSKLFNPFSQINKHKTVYHEFRRTRTIATPHLNIRDLFLNYYAELKDIPNSSKTKIYISLHLVPEATLNYFAHDTTLVNHDKIITDIIDKYHNDYIFLIKEHPVMFNKRSLNFYGKITKYPNCFLIHPKYKYYELVEKSDICMSWAGSIGWEAPFLGKKTLNIIRPFYFIKGFNNHFENYDDVIANFSNKIESLCYSNEKYCTVLNNYFQYILFTGYCNEKYNSKQNVQNIAKEVNYFYLETQLSHLVLSAGKNKYLVRPKKCGLKPRTY